MYDTNGIHKKIIDFLTPQIEEWLQKKSKIVIGIDGNSGVGKSTLSFSLSKTFPDSCRLSVDLYKTGGAELLDKCLDSKDPYLFFTKDYFDYSLLAKHIISFKNSRIKNPINFKIGGKDIIVDLNKQVLFVDGVFLYNNYISNHVDKKILLVLDDKDIHKRRKTRYEMQRKLKYDDKIGNKIDEAWDKYITKVIDKKKIDVILHLDILH
jgi:uridine kinase